MTAEPIHKDFRSVNAKYDQDSINGITEKEYSKLFEILKNQKNINTVLDLGGGSGKLTKLLIDQKFDAYLCDIADNMISEAVNNGIPKEKTIIDDLLNCNISNKFDAVILKSAMHEFPKEKMNQIHETIYKIVNNGGVFIDLDVHQPNQECADWLKKWVNLKDSVAELDLLVKNRNFYTEEDIEKSLLHNNFKEVLIPHRFNYKLSLDTLGEMYWNKDKTKSEMFFTETRKMLQNKPEEISAIEDSEDLIIVLPAVILTAKK